MRNLMALDNLMVPKTNGQLRNIDVWEVASLRLTTFHDVPLPEPVPQYWAQVFDTRPDQLAARPEQQTSQATGSVHGNHWALEIGPGRADWKLEAEPRQTGQGQSLAVSNVPFTDVLPSVGPVSTATESFAVVGKWLESFVQPTRVAFGAVLNQRATSLRDGYAIAKRYLPGINFGESEPLDFSYQINRRRLAVIDDSLVINRLAKWSVVAQESFEVKLQASMPPSLRALAPTWSCRLDLDINTVSDVNVSELIPKTKLSMLFDELMELGIEIASEGDVQ